MNFIDDLISFTRKYLYKINFGRSYLYLKISDIKDSEINHKNLEKRFMIKDISLNSIVDGRLTISIPGNISANVSEIIIISE